jgi:hypothetical protein
MVELLARKYTGSSDFWRNIFWLGVVCGGIILLHILLLLFLCWRTRMPLHEALSIPRFELLLILVLPAICQASAFVIQGIKCLQVIMLRARDQFCCVHSIFNLSWR